MDFRAPRGLAHGLPRLLVRLQVKRQSVLLSDAGQNDAHHVGDRQAHLLKHGSGLLFYVGVDSGTDNGICGHASIVAHLSYNTRILLSSPEPLFRFGWRQVVLAGHYLTPSLAFQLEPGALSDPAAGRSSRRKLLAPPPISRYNLPMNRSAQEILEDARQLPLSEVNWLIESLLQEEDGAPEAEIEAAWDGEIKRRLDEIDSGAVELIAGEQVRAEMIASLSPQARARLCI